MKAIGIIPARMAASRFPGKPMARICGMPMVGHCYHRTKNASGLVETYVASCDQEILDYIQSIGGKGVMTSKHHTRASTRTAEAVEIIEKKTGHKIDVVVMVQGDEPLIPTEAIEMTLSYFSDPSVSVVNIMSKIRDFDTFKDKNNVKVVVNNTNDALYFSREPIPSPWKGWDDSIRYLQTGIIAFRRAALLQFNQMPETYLEQIESIDMNRILESCGRIRMVPIDSFTIGVDTPEELVEAEKHLKKDSTLLSYMDI